MDLFIVTMSIVSLLVPDLNAGIVRTLRAFRIIRLFGRVASLRKASRTSLFASSSFSLFSPDI